MNDNLRGVFDYTTYMPASSITTNTINTSFADCTSIVEGTTAKRYVDQKLDQLKEKIYDILKDMEKIDVSKEEWMALLEDC